MLHIVKKFLKINNFPELTSAFEEYFLSHPNYPSIYAVTDSFTQLSIENLAVKVPADQFQELPETFLTFHNNDLVLLNKKKGKLFLEDEKGKKKTIETSTFLTTWNGIVIVVEPNTETKTTKNENITQQIGVISSATLIIALSFLISKHSWLTSINLLLSILGIYISILIWKTKKGEQNALSSKLCELTKTTSCSSVIQSVESKLFFGLEFSDLPILFFTTNILSLLLLPQQTLVVLTIVSVLSLPVIAYSVWLQKFQLKKWCTLCLLTALLVIVQTTINFPYTFNQLEWNIMEFFPYLTLLTTVSTIWFFLRNYVTTNTKNAKELYEMKRFKRNEKVFNALYTSGENYEDFRDLKGIIFGKAANSKTITLFLSPSCGHCHTAFEESYKLALKFPNHIQLKVLFNINPENQSNPYTPVVDALLQWSLNDMTKAQDALVDWHINKLSLENWLKKWQVAGSSMLANNQIVKQYEFCLKNQFNYTPVKFLDYRLFPNEYEIKDLQYFIEIPQENSDEITNQVG